MKNIFILLSICLVIQGCTKIEEEAVECVPALAQPTISNTVYNKEIGDNLSVLVTNPDANLDYRWTLPDGTTKSGTILSLYLDRSSRGGTYKVASVKEDGSCTSKEVLFTVNLDLSAPSCNIESNKFRINTSTPYNTGNGVYEYSSYYAQQFTWNVGGGKLYVFYKNPPTSTARYDGVMDKYYGDLADGEVVVKYGSSNFDTYTAVYGGVYSQYINGVYTISFCNLEFEEEGSPNNNFIGSANLTVQ
jgi:hypothetical protein